MKGLIPTLLCDFYKVSHREQYPDNTEIVYSTWTPRSGKYSNGIDEVVVFGFQGFIKEYLIDFFNDYFFKRDKKDIVNEYSRYIKNCLFVSDPYTKHIEDLHDIGYLPLKIAALEEGTIVPFGVPTLTIENTDKRFFWLTNYIESLMSSHLWKPSTVASIALRYKRILSRYANETFGDSDFVPFQGHDFCMRGMSCVEDSARNGVGHLLSFVGTDNIPSIQYAESYYGADIEKELVGCSVNATEHSVMCAGGKDDEESTFVRLIRDIYPTGILSIVSDTWDLWNVLTVTLPKIKDHILSRDGGEGSIDKVVIRPDSGDPVLIMCGDPSAKVGSPEHKGVVELLWEVFGGTESKEGYKVLDSHIGAIYGDSITVERCEAICEGLKKKGFASTNVVFGIGSYTYQYVTRDTLGYAIKSTSVTIDGVEHSIFKDPVTDDGVKKSNCGRVSVFRDEETKNIVVIDKNSNPIDIKRNISLLKDLFLDGKLLSETDLNGIKERIESL